MYGDVRFMMQSVFTVEENIKIAVNTYKMVLAGDTSAISGP